MRISRKLPFKVIKSTIWETHSWDDDGTAALKVLSDPEIEKVKKKFIKIV